MSIITSEDVDKVLKLSKLSASKSEVKSFTSQLLDILEYADSLNNVNTRGINPTFNISNGTNFKRLNNPEVCLRQTDALKNGSRKDGLFIAADNTKNE